MVANNSQGENTMKKLILFSIFIFITASCAPSQEEIQSTVQASVAQTQNAMPTVTRLPTDTPVPTVTATITASPSPAPDLRIIQIEPKEFLLQKSDLPQEGKYFLPGP